jgi:hypothetical protein
MKCIECNAVMPRGRLKTCSDECRESRRKARSTSLSTRHMMLRRILESERVPMSDQLYNPAVFESLLLKGCHYCQAELMYVTGISLDRLGEKHTFKDVVPCCAICNRLKSDGLKTGGFTYEEMVAIVGPAVAEVRRRRNSIGRPQDGTTRATWTGPSERLERTQ